MKKSEHKKATKRDTKAGVDIENAKTVSQPVASKFAEEVEFQKFIDSLPQEEKWDLSAELEKRFEQTWSELSPRYRNWATALQSNDLAEFAMAAVHEIHRRLTTEKVALTEEEERREAALAITRQCNKANIPGMVPKLSGAHVLGMVVDLSLASLRFAALRGHKVGVEEFCGKLQDYVECLNEDALKSPSLYLKEAKTSRAWPVLYSLNSSLGTDVEEIQEKLHIGELQILNLKPNAKGKVWSVETPANKVAVALIATMQQISLQAHTGELEEGLKDLQNTILKKRFEGWLTKCKDLPFFGSDSLDQWGPHIWDFVLLNTNGRPEKCEGLKELGNARKAKGNAYVRARIKEELLSAISRVVAFQPGILMTNERLKYFKSQRAYLRRQPAVDPTALLSELVRIEQAFTLNNASEAATTYAAWLTLANLMDENIPFSKLYESAMSVMDFMNREAPNGSEAHRTNSSSRPKQ